VRGLFLKNFKEAFVKSTSGKLLVICLTLILSLSILASCTSGVKETTPATTAVQVTDQEDRVVTLDEVPERIISLAPSSTEILFALGLGDKVVGVTQYCNYPPEAQEKTKIGGFSASDIDVSVEQIVALDPDLIIATETHMTDVVPKLEQFVPKAKVLVLLTQTESFDDVFNAIEMVGKCTGTEDRADQLVSSMRNRINAITDKTNNLAESARPKVLYIVWQDPIFVIGGGTLGNSLIEAAGGTNVFQDIPGSPMVDLETIIDRNPDIILASTAVGTGADLPYQFALNEERLSGVNARINNQVYGANDDLYGRPGPRLVDALEELARIIHPELFP
jgi:iron complex transport system substrate-binding protein